MLFISPSDFITYFKELAKLFSPEFAIALLFALFFMSAFAWVLKRLIKQMQSEIDRLAEDNRKYREVYLRKFEYNDVIKKLKAENSTEINKEGN